MEPYEKYINLYNFMGDVEGYILSGQYPVDVIRGLTLALKILKREPVEDVAPVIHAYWEPRESTLHVEKSGACSNCGEAWPISDTEYFYYCPNCGAIMDKEKEG